ncbi:unnamed protein product [Rotaria sp. Silwood2]|nr:unnamed protein product [Rotaria sp. Silwood2]
MTNFIPLIFPLTNNKNITKYFYGAVPVVYGNGESNCSCDQTPLCTVPTYIDENIRLLVPGILIGCFIVEALLQSNLFCFYNQSCIETLKHLINPYIELNTSALNQTLPSRFAPNSTIRSIVDQLMVEEWINTTSHKAYYDRYQPITCT